MVWGTTIGTGPRSSTAIFGVSVLKTVHAAEGGWDVLFDLARVESNINGVRDVAQIEREDKDSRIDKLSVVEFFLHSINLDYLLVLEFAEDEFIRDLDQISTENGSGAKVQFGMFRDFDVHRAAKLFLLQQLRCLLSVNRFQQQVAIFQSANLNVCRDGVHRFLNEERIFEFHCLSRVSAFEDQKTWSVVLVHPDLFGVQILVRYRVLPLA